MESNKVNVQGSDVTIKSGSEHEARELAARAEHGVLVRDHKVDEWIDGQIDSAGRIVDTIGRPTFVWIAWALAIVGSVVAFLSWSKLMPDEWFTWLFGMVGVAITLAAKVAAGRWAQALNYSNKEQANLFCTVAFVCLLMNMVAGAAFQAAVDLDNQAGLATIDAQAAELRREARSIDYEAERMRPPGDTLDILQWDLDQALNRPALNNAGVPTDLSVATVIGWGTDTYCMPGTQYPSYVDRYCPDIIALQRNVMAREAFEAKLDEAQLKRDAATALEATKPSASSGLALGKQMSSGNAPWRKYLIGVFLMLIIEGAMVMAQFIAKRHPKGVVAVGPEVKLEPPE